MNPRLLSKFKSQKSGAIARGIEWLLTPEEWVAWWGDDIERRGQGKDNLQMQRKNDTGPYALWNISKGTPRQNAATARVQQKIRTEQLIASGYFDKARPEPQTPLSDPDHEPPETEAEMLQSILVSGKGIVLNQCDSSSSNFMRRHT